MKKIKVFEGVINGKTYDTVEAYNAKIQELTDQDAVFEAHTKTVWKDVDEPDEAPTANTTESKLQVALNATPGFGESDEYYLDKLTGGDDGTFATTLLEAEEECQNVLFWLKKLVPGDNVDDIRDIRNKYVEILKVLDQDEKNSQETLNRLKKSIHVLYQSLEVVSMYKEYYEGYSKILDRVLQFESKPIGDKTQERTDKIENKLKESTDEREDVETEEVVNAVNKLLKQFTDLFASNK